jgi:hypothetical protein
MKRLIEAAQREGESIATAREQLLDKIREATADHGFAERAMAMSHFMDAFDEVAARMEGD